MLPNLIPEQLTLQMMLAKLPPPRSFKRLLQLLHGSQHLHYCTVWQDGITQRSAGDSVGAQHVLPYPPSPQRYRTAGGDTASSLTAKPAVPRADTAHGAHTKDQRHFKN